MCLRPTQKSLNKRLFPGAETEMVAETATSVSLTPASRLLLRVVWVRSPKYSGRARYS
jgi:hypothetical protein